ncbi:MAG: LysM peptidoglycan-binding domain-containing protein [Deltaproteobacteria bacterium]|nr:LysM peptidoglycan-binding domain-containing protein [Deltaproteobacteria bacterium]MBW1819576.1 LysM peptidoglycan-binding domain-containing protein [Deltaproteobacteria bacterium]MBW2285624.1 LysM peptidoglycan-binding domain-containing protein [Deltaproteobacteria bacterium]
MKNGIRYILFAIGVLIVLGGCAATGEKPAGDKTTAADAEGYLRSAQDFEKKGDLVNALKQYKLARTVDQDSQAANDGIRRVKKALRVSAEKHYASGLGLHKQGKYGEARQEFLKTLRLRPDHKGAAEMLTTKKRTYKVKRYVVHVLQPGESISILAKKYYGDYHKFPIIAQYNKMKDATKVFPGQEIKVPEVEGLPFHVEKTSVKTEEVAPGAAAASAPEPDMLLEVEEKEFVGEGEVPDAGEEEGAPAAYTEAVEETAPSAEEEEEPVDQVAIYRDAGIDLYKEKNYDAALIEFDKVLIENPDDMIALEYAYKASFEYAMELLNNKDYLSARDGFAGALKYNNDCRKCHNYIKHCEKTYKEIHYKRGMQYFDKEKLEEAIYEWMLVSTEDPDYKKVNYLIKKAEIILKKVEELKGK